MSDNEAYWQQRHEDYQGELAAVGDIRRSQRENLALYAQKKRWLVELIQSLEHVNPKNKSVLDAGCGIGLMSEVFYLFKAHVTGVDASSIAIDEARCRCPDGNFHASSLLDFKLSEPFDITFCADVLYHIVDDENWRKAVENLASHTKLGGHLVVLDQLKSEPSSPAPHVKFRTKSMYDNELVRAGMLDVTPLHQPHFIIYRQTSE